MNRGQVIVLMLIWYAVGALSAFLVGLWWHHPDQRPVPLRQMLNTCDASKTQVLHTDGAAISEYVIDRGVKCVVVMGDSE